MAAPILLLVQHALPPHIQALPHVAQLVNEFVLPSTIDSAVYNDLPRVLKAFEGFRPCTVGAMNGAAAKGRLDILQRLHAERREGCTSAAFIAAASNGHVSVLMWLHINYPRLQRLLPELTEAAKHGHTPIIEFVVMYMRPSRSELERLLEIAAANGHLEVVRFLRRFALDPLREVYPHAALVAAAANGHEQVAKYLVNTNWLSLQEAHEKALGGGHWGIVELLDKAAAERRERGGWGHDLALEDVEGFW